VSRKSGEDYLRKGDILFMMNGEKLTCKSKFDIILKLSSQTCPVELSFLRRVSGNSFGSPTAMDLIPYHNGIFAQNSIKLAMRKYEKLSMKSDNDMDPSSNKEFNYERVGCNKGILFGQYVSLFITKNVLFSL
jgi:hypothetical protein